MHALQGITVTADKTKVLAKLKANRETHGKIVAEARDGYIDKARDAVEKRLVQLRERKLVSLQFSLTPPQDHTDEYDTVIQMLEMHTGAEIELNGDQVRNFIEDKWGWKGLFLASNALYSKMAADEAGAVDPE